MKGKGILFLGEILMDAHIIFAGRFSYRPGTGCELHSHNKDYQVQLIYSGTGNMCVDSSCFKVEKGDVIFMKKGCMHSYVAEATMKTVELKFDTDTPEFLEDIPIKFKDKNDQLYNEMSKIVIEGQRRGYMYKELCNSLLLECLIYMNRISNGQYSILPALSEGKDSEAIDGLNLGSAMEAVDAYIYRNLDKSFTLSELASGCGYNQDYLYRVIRKYKSMSLIQYVNHIKYEESKRLITYTDLPISEIAWNLGFESCQYFSRFFKKHAGIAPSEYSLKVRDEIRIKY